MNFILSVSPSSHYIIAVFNDGTMDNFCKEIFGVSKKDNEYVLYGNTIWSPTPIAIIPEYNIKMFKVRHKRAESSIPDSTMKKELANINEVKL